MEATVMVENFQTTKSRRVFYIMILSLLCSLFLIEHLLLPYLFNKPIVINETILISIVDKLFVSVLVTIAIALFTFWIAPSNKKNAQIKILQPKEIGESLIEARVNIPEIKLFRFLQRHVEQIIVQLM
jgi:hypothetical protein